MYEVVKNIDVSSFFKSQVLLLHQTTESGVWIYIPAKTSLKKLGPKRNWHLNYFNFRVNFEDQELQVVMGCYFLEGSLYFYGH